MAKRRLADEYDAAQERGEVGQQTGGVFGDGSYRACNGFPLPPKECREAEKAELARVQCSVPRIGIDGRSLFNHQRTSARRDVHER